MSSIKEKKSERRWPRLLIAWAASKPRDKKMPEPPYRGLFWGAVLILLAAAGCSDEHSVPCGSQCALLVESLRYDGCMANLVWDPSGEAIRVVTDYDECGFYVPTTPYMTLADALLAARRSRPHWFRKGAVMAAEVVTGEAETQQVAGDQLLSKTWGRTLKASSVSEIRLATSPCARPVRRQQVIYVAGVGLPLERPMLRWKPSQTVRDVVEQLRSEGNWGGKEPTRVVVLRRVADAEKANYEIRSDSGLRESPANELEPFDTLLLQFDEPSNSVVVAGEASGKPPEPTRSLSCAGFATPVRTFPVSSGECIRIRLSEQPITVNKVLTIADAAPGDVLFYPPRLLPGDCGTQPTGGGDQVTAVPPSQNRAWSAKTHPRLAR